jgi:hypothetical protein
LHDCRVDSPGGLQPAQFYSNEIPDLTDLFIEWKKDLTPEASTLNMAIAPAAAFPPIVVPLIRMPE